MSWDVSQHQRDGNYGNHENHQRKYPISWPEFKLEKFSRKNRRADPLGNIHLSSVGIPK
jgi:hypothetical protein